MNSNTAHLTESDEKEEALIQVRNLKKYYPITGGILKRNIGNVYAVDDVSFDIYQGETFAVVGESGCGKTTLGKTVARLHKPTSGQITFDGKDITGLSNKQLKSVRRDLQVVYQDPTSSLNPRKRIKDIIAEPLIVHDIGSKKERRKRVKEMMDKVDLPAEFMYRYPNALSGGQKQRVAIARALILNPKFLVLDEPTSALDVSVQAKVISLLEDLQEEFGLTYLMISHDLSLVKNIADRIAVMYLGKFMEVGSSEQLFKDTLNPYTEQLLSAIPVVESEEEDMKPARVDIRGEPPDPSSPPSGCSFNPRCHRKFDACPEIEPSLAEIKDNHYVRCLLYPGEKESEVLEQISRDKLEELRDTEYEHDAKQG